MDYICQYENNEKIFFDGEYHKSVFHALQIQRAKIANQSELIIGRMRKAPTIKEMLDVASQFKDPPEWTL